MKKLGFGFMRLPLQDKNELESIDYTVLQQMVDTYMQKGFCYFDTAYMYHGGVSEVAIRETVVKHYPRDKFILADKMPVQMITSKKEQEKTFNEQLARCGVEYFDNYLLHNLGEGNYKQALKLDTFNYVQKLKDAGLVKRIGFSYHDNAKLLDEILTANPHMEFVQLQLNYLDWENDSIQSGACYEVAKKHGKPVIVMEPLKGGMLAAVPEKAAELFKEYAPAMSFASWGIRYAASLDNVELVLSGMSDLAQLLDNISYMQDFKALTQKEYEIIEEAKKIIDSSVAIACTACQYCVDTCPKNIAIPKYFALYNNWKYSGSPSFSLSNVYYNNYIQKHGKASDCIECRQCEEHCPQKLEIISLLKDVAEVFESETE